jgi:hypothetical protein
MTSYQCWLFDKDKHALTLRMLECAEEEQAEECAWTLLRQEAPMIRAAEVWNGQKRVFRVEAIWATWKDGTKTLTGTLTG